MKNFTAAWKNKANLKTITNADQLAYCALKAVNAKHPGKEMIFTYFVKKAYTPRNKIPSYRAVQEAQNILAVNNRWRPLTHVLGVSVTEIFETEEELDLFKSLIDSLKVNELEMKELA